MTADPSDLTRPTDTSERVSGESSLENQAPAIAVETLGLTRCFGPLTAVSTLNIAVTAGSIFGLLGRMVRGRPQPSRCSPPCSRPLPVSAKVAGLDIVRRAVEVRRRIGYVSQMLSADGGLTGYENLLLFARIYGIPRTARRDRIINALQFMGLGEAERTLVRNYSGGMIRRLEIAQSMLHRPSVLFLDEPTVGLDPVARHAVWQHLHELRTQVGTTILMTTHDMEKADELCEVIGF